MSPSKSRPFAGYRRPATMPDSVAELVSAWGFCSKSPWSDSFYSMPGVTWGYKPEGCLRAADHWDFLSRGERHCVPDRPVESGAWAVARYEGGVWRVLYEVPPRCPARQRHASPSPIHARQRPALLSSVNSQRLVALAEGDVAPVTGEVFDLCGGPCHLIPADVVAFMVKSGSRRVLRVLA